MAVPTAYSENEVGHIRPRKIGYWPSSMTAQTDDFFTLHSAAICCVDFSLVQPSICSIDVFR